MTDVNDNDRRQSFRIEDQALVEFTLLAEGNTATDLDSCFEPSSQFDLLSDLQQLDNELQHQLFKLTETNTVLASALQLLNRKLERLALQAGANDSTNSLQSITLSEGGLSLQIQQPVTTGSIGAVRIRLLPGGYALQSLARVVYCLDQADGHQRVGLTFVNLSEVGRDLIARHILEQQALKRRIERQQNDQEAMF
ncbi:MAG: PilZ domain-containing protein [Halopseudomonas sp.]